MAKIRILVVDDSVVFRRALTDELSRDSALEVVGTAPNGRIALAKLGQLSPDLVILDVEMPEMNGLQALKELRKTYPHLAVIMFSALTERGAEATLDALALGATDYFTKPAESWGLDESLRVIREQMIPMIKAICTPSRPQNAPTGASSISLTPAKVPVATGVIRVLVIGASTGGPNALSEIFTQLPADFPVPILIAQHMPPMFTRLLAERLSAQSPIRVQEASSGSVLKPGEAWVAAGDYHMAVAMHGTDYRLLLHQGPPENSCRPSVDVLLRSVAKTFGADSLTVILTGMGQDGLRGCESIRALGGQVLAQDEATSVVWGMPGYVAQAGLADRVLPLPLIAGEIVQRVRAKKRPVKYGV
jgi:two-component system, chemotaxis family, protein-glutamate methylesterase/glutaminase